MPTLKEHVSGKSYFSYYREDNLYYRTDTGITFAVPLADAQGATFLSIEKSLFFMRWIRKHLDQEANYHKYDRARDKV